MRYLTRYDRTAHRLDGMGRRVCRSCKAVWPCEKHPIEANGGACDEGAYDARIFRAHDRVCGDCGHWVCSCPTGQPIIDAEFAAEPPQPQTDERLPPGWTHVCIGMFEQFDHISRVSAFKTCSGWFTNAADENHPAVRDYNKYPTALQAMAAALGASIRPRCTDDPADVLYDYSFDRRCWWGGYAIIAPCRTADDAAFAACEHHARENGYA